MSKAKRSESSTPKSPPRYHRVTVDDVRTIALSLPDTTEKPSYGTPGFRVADKLFARVLDDGASIVVRTTFEQRDELVARAPGTYAVTPHYERHPMVVVRLGTIGRAELREVLAVAWRTSAPQRLIEGRAARQ